MNAPSVNSEVVEDIIARVAAMLEVDELYTDAQDIVREHVERATGREEEDEEVWKQRLVEGVALKASKAQTKAAEAAREVAEAARKADGAARKAAEAARDAFEAEVKALRASAAQVVSQVVVPYGPILPGGGYTGPVPVRSERNWVRDPATTVLMVLMGYLRVDGKLGPYQAQLERAEGVCATAGNTAQLEAVADALLFGHERAFTGDHRTSVGLSQEERLFARHAAVELGAVFGTGGTGGGFPAVTQHSSAYSSSAFASPVKSKLIVEPTAATETGTEYAQARMSIEYEVALARGMGWSGMDGTGLVNTITTADVAFILQTGRARRVVALWEPGFDPRAQLPITMHKVRQSYAYANNALAWVAGHVEAGAIVALRSFYPTRGMTGACDMAVDAYLVESATSGRGTRDARLTEHVLARIPLIRVLTAPPLAARDDESARAESCRTRAQWFMGKLLEYAAAANELCIAAANRLAEPAAWVPLLVTPNVSVVGTSGDVYVFKSFVGSVTGRRINADIWREFGCGDDTLFVGALTENWMGVRRELELARAEAAARAGEAAVAAEAGGSEAELRDQEAEAAQAALVRWERRGWECVLAWLEASGEDGGERESAAAELASMLNRPEVDAAAMDEVWKVVGERVGGRKVAMTLESVMDALEVGGPEERDWGLVTKFVDESWTVDGRARGHPRVGHFIHLLHTLRAMVDAGVVHCDIRDANVVYHSDGRAWFIDWDYAGRTDEGHTYPDGFRANVDDGQRAPVVVAAASTAGGALPVGAAVVAETWHDVYAFARLMAMYEPGFNQSAKSIWAAAVGTLLGRPEGEGRGDGGVDGDGIGSTTTATELDAWIATALEALGGITDKELYRTNGRSKRVVRIARPYTTQSGDSPGSPPREAADDSRNDDGSRAGPSNT